MQDKKIKWLNTLRALGLILVLAYHLLPQSAYVLPGGFVGVDIFFVLSGYLTTTLIVQNLAVGNKFQLLSFFTRRIKRLIPALVFMLVVTIPLLLLIPIDYRTNILSQVTAVLGQSTNYYEISQNGSYANLLSPHLYIHTWTLAVEVQFYIIWAVFIFILCRLIKKLRTLRITLSLIALFITFFSAISMFLTADAVASSENFTPAYFATHTHIFPLMIGSLIGLIFVSRNVSTSQKSPTLLKMAYVIAPLLIIALIFFAQTLNFDSIQTYHYGLFAVTAIVGILIILILVFMQNTERKDLRICEYLSNRSYSVYLFHWPLFIIITAFFEEFQFNNPWLTALVIVVFSFIFAEIFYRFIELPSKNFSKSEISRIQVIITVILLTTLTIISVILVVSAPTKTSTELELDAQSRQSEFGILQKLNDNLASINDVDPVGVNAHPEIMPEKPSEKVAREEQERLAKEAAKRNADEAQKTAAQMSAIANSPAIIIGDSVTNMSTPTLKATIPGAYVDAMGNRRMCQGLDVVNRLKSSNALPHVVVLALGQNILQNDYDCARQAVGAVDGDHKLIFVTGFRNDGLTAMDEFASFLRGLAGGNVSIADWNTAIRPLAQEPGMMSADHFHPASPQAKQIYANTIRDAILRVRG